jgi:GAF domain-containing protein
VDHFSGGGSAGHGLLPEYDRIERETIIRPGPGSLIGRVALEGRTVTIRDAWNDPLYEAKEAARAGNVRSMLGVPLLREGVVIGAIGLARATTEPYSEREIQLVTTFADQAVIAMENARLLTETREALEQQTATAEVLGVINSSPGDLAPVFDAMLEKAMRLCSAAFGGLGIWRGDRFEWTADRGLPPPFAAYIANAKNEVSVGPRSGFDRVARGDGYVQFHDISTSSFYQAGDPYTRAIVDLGGARTTLSVPLARDDGVIGVFGFFRQEVRPFDEKQIALVKNFAAQAVIAMENARLITETREALEQQTATAEVLTVMSSIPRPVPLTRSLMRF